MERKGKKLKKERFSYHSVGLPMTSEAFYTLECEGKSALLSRSLSVVAKVSGL